MGKIAVIGICGNSMFFQIDHFHQKGETLSANSLYEEIGGKGINQAVAAARMGSEVSFLGAVGNDVIAEFCENVLAENNIKSCLAQKEGGHTATAVILTDGNGENQVTVYRGASLNVEDVVQFESNINQADVLLLQQEVPIDVNLKAIELAEKHGVKVILNPAPPYDSEKLYANVFMVTPNEHEAKYIEELTYENKVVTLGNKGCIINDNIEILPIKTECLDTTGAGDTFNGILASCIACGMDIQKACRMANIGAGISVSRKNVLDAIPYKNEIERIMNNE